MIEHSWRNFRQATPRWGVSRFALGKLRGWQIDLGVFRWYLAALLLTACAHAPGAADRHALDAVHAAWDDSELPPAGDCLERVEVRRHDTPASYVDACTELHSAGCLTYALRGVMGERSAVIELAPGYHEDQSLVQHEACHAMVMCKLKRPASDPWDARHSDPRVWEAAGGATSVQARARR